MARIHLNNFRTTLAADFSNVATSITLTDNIPTLGVGNSVRLTLYSGSTFEIIEISNLTGAPTYAVASRALEGTTASSWAAGTVIECRITANSVDDKANITDLPAPGSTPVQVFIASQTASASAHLNFTGLGDYSKITFVLAQIKPATDDKEIQLLTSANNGSSYDVGASDYQYALSGRSGATTIAFSGSPTTKISLCSGAVGLDPGNATGELITGVVDLYDPTSTDFTQLTWNVGFTNANGSPGVCVGTGTRLSAAAVNAVRFIMESGNITSGTIYAYGTRKTA